MPECRKCGVSFPLKMWVDGKRRNLQHRKYCFECSPFGQHNTKQIEKKKKLREKTKGRLRKCTNCGKEFKGTSSRCAVCNFNIRQEVTSKKVEGLIGGYKCWHCGYSKCRRNICFHHVDPRVKLFGLTTREMMLSWDRVWSEMQKCVQLCSNCHGEAHEGIISKARIKELHESKWQVINANIPPHTDFKTSMRSLDPKRLGN